MTEFSAVSRLASGDVAKDYPARTDDNGTTWYRPREGEGWTAQSEQAHPDYKVSTKRPTPRIAQVLGNKARSFLAEQNVTDRDELLCRARRHAQDQTHSLRQQTSARIVNAFVAEVDRSIRRIPISRAAARPVTQFDDFDDALMFD